MTFIEPQGAAKICPSWTNYTFKEKIHPVLKVLS